MTDAMLKEYRCQNCQKLFFKGNVHHATIEIKCKNCKEINTIKGTNCDLWLLADEQGSYKRSDESRANKNVIRDAIIQCENCEKTGNCEHYQNIKHEELCPLCKSSLK